MRPWSWFQKAPARCQTCSRQHYDLDLQKLAQYVNCAFHQTAIASVNGSIKDSV